MGGVRYLVLVEESVIYVLNKIGGKEMVELGNGIFTNTPEQRKFLATSSMVKGIAERGDYHDAMTALPSTLTEEQELVCRTIILLNEAKQKEDRENRRGWTAMDEFYESKDYVLFFGFL